MFYSTRASPLEGVLLQLSYAAFFVVVVLTCFTTTLPLLFAFVAPALAAGDAAGFGATTAPLPFLATGALWTLETSAVMRSARPVFC